MEKETEDTHMKRKINKSKFITDLPTTMPAKDVVAKAKSAGIKLSEKYVYNIRAKAKARGGKPGKPGRPKGSKRANGATVHSGDETSFVTVAIAIGVTRARELLDGIVASGKSVFG